MQAKKVTRKCWVERWLFPEHLREELHYGSSVYVGSASMDSANHELEIFRKK